MTVIRAMYGDDAGVLLRVLHQYATGKIKKCPHKARLQAIEMLLERGWGKPTQVIAGDPEAPLAMKVTFGGRYRP